MEVRKFEEIFQLQCRSFFAFTGDLTMEGYNELMKIEIEEFIFEFTIKTCMFSNNIALIFIEFIDLFSIVCC